MKIRLLSVGLLLLALLAPQCLPPKGPVYVVTRVVDGDTIKVEYEGTSASVRLIGVDTPETVHPRKPVEPFGPEASAFTKSLLPAGELVHLHFDNIYRDRYGRLLAYVYRVKDGMHINLEIVAQGAGRVYTRYPFKFMEEFLEHEAIARKSKRGLWGNHPSEF